VDGTLDTTFGSGGKVVVALSGVSDQANAVVVQPDGRIVTAGFAFNGTNNDFALLRVNPDGTPDGSFGAGGKVLTPLGPMAEEANALVLQPDGKLAAGGYTTDTAVNQQLAALVRYDATGALDPTFGTGGKVVTGLGAHGTGPLEALALQPDGKIVGGGAVTVGSPDYAAVRFNANGTFDAAFGTGGMAVVPGSYGSGWIRAVVLQPDGGILLAGEAYIDGTDAFALARVHANGTPDASFGDGGALAFSPGPDDDQAYAVALAPDGKVIVAGQSLVGSTRRFAVLRLDPDGKPDATFGGTGVIVTPLGVTHDTASGAVAQPDGKVLVAGSAYYFGAKDEDAVVACFNLDGSPDPTFGAGGTAATNAGLGNDRAFAVALQPDGKVLTAGTGQTGSNTEFQLLRYDANGAPDRSFGTAGRVLTAVGPASDTAYAVYSPFADVTASGKIDGLDLVVVRMNQLVMLPDGDPPATAPAPQPQIAAAGRTVLAPPPRVSLFGRTPIRDEDATVLA